MRAPPSVRKWKDIMRFEIRYFSNLIICFRFRRACVHNYTMRALPYRWNSIRTLLGGDPRNPYPRKLPAGKGYNSRKYQHITDAICRLLVCHTNKKPLGKTKQIWDMLQTAKGVTVLHLLPDCNHYEAHSREYAIIKALGLDDLSTVHAMVLWRNGMRIK